jgi:hypothetical protein
MAHSNHQDSEGNNIPSVSQVPGIYGSDMSGFEDWICKGLHGKEDRCCTKAKRSYYEEAANLGNDIHELREAFLKGEPFSDGIPEYQAAVFDPIAAFYKASGYKPMFIEEQMTGAAFGGTLDGAGTFSVPFWEEQRKTFWANTDPKVDKLPTTESLWIEDLKIKSKLDKLHPLQLYGYRELLMETKGLRADWGLIIRREKKLDKTPQIQLKAYYLPAYKAQWDASILMWNFING